MNSIAWYHEIAGVGACDGEVRRRGLSPRALRRGGSVVMSRPQAVTIRLDAELHREAIAISNLTGLSLKAIVEEGLRKEVALRLRDGRLADAVRVVTTTAGAVVALPGNVTPASHAPS